MRLWSQNLDWGLRFDRPTRVRLARENRVPSRAKDCKKLFSSPRPPARVESHAPLDPLAGLLASVGLLALAAGARGASSSSAANGFDDMTHERQRRGDASKMNLPLEPRCLGRRLTSTDARATGVDAAGGPRRAGGVPSVRRVGTPHESPMRVWPHSQPHPRRRASVFISVLTPGRGGFSHPCRPQDDGPRSSPALSSARSRARSG